MSNSNLLDLIPYVLSLLLLVHLGSNYWRLRHIPGPILAKFSDLWRLYAVWHGDAEITYFKLHQQYGDVVRVGPNCASISKPDVIPSIYGIGKGFVKASARTAFETAISKTLIGDTVRLLLRLGEHSQWQACNINGLHD